MRRPFTSTAILALLAASAAAMMARAQEPPVPQRTMPQPVPHLISSHQIDRYDAIASQQRTLKDNPRSLADWVILGELAHEVAIDLPSDQSGRYYDMSRDAYEKALALSPENAGLKAAVQFAKDQQANSHRFESARDQATTTYLEARRRDLAAANYTPSLRVYTPPMASPMMPSPTTAVPPVNTNPDALANANAITNATPPAAVIRNDPSPAETTPPAAQRDAASMGTRQFYSYPLYQPYSAPQGTPFTYQQYSSAYNAPNAANNAGLPPLTVQRYYQLHPDQISPATATGRQSGNPFR